MIADETIVDPGGNVEIEFMASAALKRQGGLFYILNAGLQLRHAISTQAAKKRLLEKHAIAPSAARLC